MKSFRERFADLFNKSSVPPVITENSSLYEIAVQHPHLFEFIERKYGVKTDFEDKPLSLKEFVEKYGLPPAPVMFMEVQTSIRTAGVRMVSAREAKALLDKRRDTKILDVRDDWEVQICKLEGSEVLSTQLLDEILTEWPKTTALLLYCHYGVRSLDAATYLADRGFSEIYTLDGGIDAWAVQIDPSLPRYQNAWC